MSVCAFIAFINRAEPGRTESQVPPDANGSLCAKEKTQRNKIKLQNSNQLISARFISLSAFDVVSTMLFSQSVHCFVFFSYISNTYFRRKAPCEKYFAFRTSMYLYVQVLLYANKAYL